MALTNNVNRHFTTVLPDAQRIRLIASNTIQLKCYDKPSIEGGSLLLISLSIQNEKPRPTVKGVRGLKMGLN